MATAAGEAHIAAQQRLRELTVAGVATAWQQLPSYDEPDAELFVETVVPLVLAAQRQSVALTSAFLTHALRRPPTGVDVDRLIGAAIRAGTPPEVVYRRPFIQTWAALADHTPWEQAIAAGRERATGAAAMDVQNSMRHTLAAAGGAEERILGYQRVPDADACEFCRLIAGRRYLSEQLMEVHPRCGCGVDVITEANRGDFTGDPENDLDITRDGVSAAVREHGELGPLLVDGDQQFAGPEVLV